jgi:hypothetical protein
MARPTKTTQVETPVVAQEPVVNEKDAIIAWLRSGNMNMFERNTRWLADRIAEGDHLK